MCMTISLPPINTLVERQTAFAAMLPRIRKVAWACFRNYRRENRHDAVSEVAAITWKWFCRLADKGKDARRFPATMTMLAIRFVRSGRRLAGSPRRRDVMNMQTQAENGFRVLRIDADDRSDEREPWRQALAVAKGAPVPDVAAFGCDYPTWLRGWSDRDRRILAGMIDGDRTKELADEFRLSWGRISQKRRQFVEGWRRYQGEEAVGPERAAA